MSISLSRGSQRSSFTGDIDPGRADALAGRSSDATAAGEPAVPSPREALAKQETQAEAMLGLLRGTTSAPSMHVMMWNPRPEEGGGGGGGEAGGVVDGGEIDAPVDGGEI